MIPKFRAWYKDDYEGTDFPEPKMIYNIQYSYDCIDERCPDDNRSCFGDYLDNKHYKVMQSTGLKDKNGKEIFEGDIVKFDNDKIGVIEYNEKLTMFQIRNTKPYIAMWDYPNLGAYINNENNIKIEIIGNIYENPALLHSNDKEN